MEMTTECQCGRAKLHCPHCGYAGLSGLSTLTRVVENEKVYSYRCRKCARVFDDLGRALCTAPHVSEGRTKTIADKVNLLRRSGSPLLDEWIHAQQVKRGLIKDKTPVVKEPSVADEIDQPVGLSKTDKKGEQP